MKTDILSWLTPTKFVSGSFLAKKLGISRNAVNKQIRRLISRGFVIEARKNRGYCLKEKADVIDVFRLSNCLKSNFTDLKIIYRKECSSTQILARKYSEQFSGQFLVVAEQQSAGYGRVQRKWLSPAGGLWFSLLLRPKILPEEVSRLTLLMSLAVSRCLRQNNIRAGIKWPNDVLVAGKKIGGILTEMSAEADIVHWVIIGTGLNVNNNIPSEIKDIAISISDILEKPADRTALLARILREFFSDYSRFLKDGFSQFLQDYKKFLLFKNEIVTVKQFTRTITGKMLGVNEKGHLIIKSVGKRYEVMAGDLLRG